MLVTAYTTRESHPWPLRTSEIPAGPTMGAEDSGSRGRRFVLPGAPVSGKHRERGSTEGK